jgi:putative transposase
MVVRIAGRWIYLRRAVDHEGEILDMLVQRRRDKRAALRLMSKAAQEARIRAEDARNGQAALLRLGIPASPADPALMSRGLEATIGRRIRIK